jgi:methylase of polypeptide subunit release factors
VDRHIDELRDSYDWEKLQGTVVDVGGGSGHISIALAQVSTHAMAKNLRTPSGLTSLKFVG